MTVEPEGERQTLTIGELTVRASNAVVRAFRGPIWTTGELAGLREQRGNRWLELVEQGGGRDGRDAHLKGFCSATTWRRLERRLADAGVELRAGQRLVVRGSVAIDDRGTLTLTVDDLDVAALLGARLLERGRLVQRLVDAGLFDANRRLPVPALPLRIGLVARDGSDGHRDVLRQLHASGYAFHVVLRSVPVEGPTAPRAIAAALATFGPADVDVAVIVRGGGAKASLDVFDQPAVAHAVATALVPVWTGIGHTGDRTVADEVASRSLPTPSAAGHALVAAVAAAHATLVEAVAGIARLVEAGLAASTARLDGHRREVVTLAGSQLARHEHAHARGSADLRQAVQRCLGLRAGELTSAAHAIRASGNAELRNARRRLADLAADSASAVRRSCVDAGGELAAAAVGLSTALPRALAGAAAPVERVAAQLQRARFDRLLDEQSLFLAGMAARLGRDVGRRLDDHDDRSRIRRAVVEAYDPQRQLARGWTLTRTVDGRLVRHVAELAEGDGLVTTSATGEVTSTVTEVRL